MEIEALLHNLGFSPNEAKIYLAGMETGPASAQDIAEKAGLRRTTGYSVLDGLVLRGIVYRTKDGGKTRYITESPKDLAKRFHDYHAQLEHSLPQLLAVYNKSQTKPRIVFYEGIEGLERIYDDTIKERPKEILEYNTSELFSLLPQLPRYYAPLRRKHKVRARRIAPNDKNWQLHANKDAEELAKTKLLSKKDFAVPTEINIYNNKVAFMSYSDKLGIIIESEGIAATMRRIYELLWARLK